MVIPEGLAEIKQEVGAAPADVLLGRKMVIVEGPSDREILLRWARTLGVDLEWAGVRILPVGGHSLAQKITSVLRLIYDEADLVVLLDGDMEAKRSARDIRRRFGSRVAVEVLSVSGIEDLFSQHAIAAWLLSQGASPAGLKAAVAGGVKAGANSGLDGLAKRLLGRPYSKPNDGPLIATLMPESGLSSEVQGLIRRLAA